MFDRILVANRGEIAVRILSACRELGISTVAVHSTVDRDSLHVELADQAVCIGPESPKASYLNADNIIAAAEITSADAIHPGYGFLAENAGFAELVESTGRTWIGARPRTIELMGDKVRAREAARSAGVPILAGSQSTIEHPREARSLASEIGYPVILKAAAGGGGRGIRIIYGEDRVEDQFGLAQAEARQAFGSDALYLEKYLDHPRHIEFQVLGDRRGRVLHLGERECSIQRRHQKLLEESPSSAITGLQRRQMGEAAVRLAAAVGYVNAGTVEFLLADDGRHYFMEMNTRIQVEHPVTEMVTGVDLVKLQIEIAAGENLNLPSQIEARGHAIECRINAEHAESFHPSAGRVTRLRWPGGPGIRIDSHVFEGYLFPSHYDSLLGKLVAHGHDRPEAIGRMERALNGLRIEGIETNLSLHRRILSNPDFRAGRVSTSFLEQMLEGGGHGP